MQKYVLSELDSGERVISEKVPSKMLTSSTIWLRTSAVALTPGVPASR